MFWLSLCVLALIVAYTFIAWTNWGIVVYVEDNSLRYSEKRVFIQCYMLLCVNHSVSKYSAEKDIPDALSLLLIASADVTRRHVD